MRVRLPAVLIIVFLAASGEPAFGCSCVPKPAPDIAFSNAAIVFEGKVIDLQDRMTPLGKAWHTFLRLLGRRGGMDWRLDETYALAVTFEAARVWRGSATRRIVVVTGRGGGDCGYEFAEGKTYVVYGHCNATGACFTDICTRTDERSRAADDLRYLATQPLFSISH